MATNESDTVNREKAIIIRIGLDMDDGKWFENIYIDGCRRFPERKLIGNPINYHNKIYESCGRTLFGRFEVLSIKWWYGISNFIDNSCPRRGAKLIMIVRKSTIYEAYSTRVFKFTERCASPQLVPQYYQDLIPDIHTWFEICKLEPMASSELISYMKDLNYAVKRQLTISKTLIDAG